MAIRVIRKEGDEILNKKSKVVEVIDDKVRDILNDMMDTLHQEDGVGLAAVQVGILKRLVVIDLCDDKTVLKLVNPIITKQKGEQEVDEGCLSFPNKFAKVMRPAEVTVEALDENGKKFKVIGKGLLAQALSHELDHLEGEVFINKIVPGTLEVINPEPKKK